MRDAEAAAAAAEIRAVLGSDRPAAEMRGQLDLLLDQAPLTAAWSVWGNEVGR